MPSLANRYPLEAAFARQVDRRGTLIMWVISNGEFSKNLTGESNGIVIPVLAFRRRLWDRSAADPGKIVALAVIDRCGTAK
jgi:hypothetical protein